METERKNYNFSLFMYRKNSISQIYLEHVQIVDFTAFMHVPRSEKGVKFSWNSVFFLICVTKQVKFKKIAKLIILE